MMRTKGCRNTQRKGQMPMALIAVALLVAGAFYGIIYADIERGTDNSDSANVEFCTVDDAVERAVLTIESELGRIITNISGNGAGTLIDRAELFGKAADDMISEKFPNTFKGVRTEIEDSNIRLALQNMRLSESELFGGTTRAMYLTASGTVDLVFTSESTITRKTVEISADATSALPLIAEASTRFELSTIGCGSALSQMVEYQLNALASNRVLNGYGMFSVGGEYGTSEIITAKDVQRAIRNSLDIIEAMCFRDCSNKSVLEHTYCDLADMIVIENGHLVIDLGAIYAQAMIQNLDEYVGRWIEYLGGDKILEIADMIVDNLIKVVNFIRNLVNKDSTKNDAINYIKSKMEKAGFSESDYRYFNTGDRISVYVGDIVVPGSEGNTVFTARTLTFDPQEIDLLDWDGWGGFLEYYRSITNAFEESLSSALKTVAMNAVGNAVIRIPVDVFDSRTYSEEMDSVITNAIEGGLRSFIDYSARSVRDCRVSDPVMCEAYEYVRSHSDEIFDNDIFNEADENVAAYICLMCGHLPVPNIFDAVRAQVHVSQQVSDDYRREVDAYLDRLKIMTEVKKETSLSEGLARSIGGYIREMHLENLVRDTVVNLTEEVSDISGINPYSRITELPGSRDFAMDDGRGNIHKEKVSVRDGTDLKIDVTTPMHNGDKNTHYIGLFDDRTARYSSVFTVSVKGAISYNVRATNPVFEMLGLFDSSYSGTVDVDSRMDIACLSGWALSGVDYKKSNTAFTDIYGAVRDFVLSLVEDLIEPLMVVLKGLEGLMDICTTAVIEYANYMSQMMERIYEVVSIPMGMLYDISNSIIQKFMDSLGLEDICIKLGSQKLVFNVYGVRIIVETNLRSLQKASKEFVTVTAEKAIADGVVLSASLAMKENSTAGKYVIISGGVTGCDWSVNMTLDPMMSSKTYFAKVSGYVRGVEFSGSFPEVVQYQMMDISTTDIPGLGAGLNNIVLPFLPGYKCSVELGLYTKYDLPVETGLLINEVELNPPGNDAGKEWVELFNNTDGTIDLLGYTLVPSGNDKKSLSIGDVVIAPKEKAVIYFPSQSLNNTGSSDSKSGTKISLYDTYGTLVDHTPSLKDSENDDRTWQRTSDGSVNWSFMSGTEGEKNNGDIPGGYMLKTLLIDYAKDAAVEVLDEMGDVVEGTEQFMEYAERVMARITEKFIDSISGCLVEACAYVKVELTDYAQTQHYGVKVMLGVDSDLVRDVLTYIASLLPVIGDHIACPEGLCAENILYQDVFLRTLAYTSISTPKVLGSLAEAEELDTAVSVKYNLSAVTTLFGDQKGRWSAEAGIVMEDVPSELIPKCFGAKKYMKSDFWLFRMVFCERGTSI